MATSGYSELRQNDAAHDSELQSPSRHFGALLRDRKSSLDTALEVMSLITTVLCVAAIAGLVASKVFIWSVETSSQPGPLPAAFFPNFGKVSTIFVNGGDFTRNDSQGDRLWDSLVPLGGGYVRVPSPRRYNLPPSEGLKSNGAVPAEMYQASVIHQIHCMGVLRNITRAYRAGQSVNDNVHQHVGHCIEYVRQAILCTGDTTLEQANEGGAFNAQGAVHECRDWTLVKSFLEENRVDDAAPGILDT